MRDLIKYAYDLKYLSDNSLTWSDVAEMANAKFGTDFTTNAIRCRVKKSELYKQNKRDNGDVPLTKEDVVSALKRGLDTTEISLKSIEDLRSQGYQIELDNGKYILCKLPLNVENSIEERWKGSKRIKFAVISDTHFNNKCVQLTLLNQFYDKCEKYGIKTVYHSGDIDEGEEMRIGHKYECYTQGADDHIAEIVKNFPYRKGIVTKFITGNHDHSMIKRCGLDIGIQIADRRPDMVYLGQSSAIVSLTPNCTLELRHPGDGTAYALSYKPQKMIESMSGGEKPNILVIGHYHKAEYLFYRNVHCLQAGCFQAQTSWEKGKQISVMLGGWIVEMEVDESGEILEFMPRFIPFYSSIKDDYMNFPRS